MNDIADDAQRGFVSAGGRERGGVVFQLNGPPRRGDAQRRRTFDLRRGLGLNLRRQRAIRAERGRTGFGEQSIEHRGAVE